MQKSINIKYDSIGIIASSLCMIHCIITPFIFVAKACTEVCCSETPVWWQMIDYAFLIISFLAIYYITKKNKSIWFKVLFWLPWAILFLTLLNHSFVFFHMHKNFIYIPAFTIVILHLYNLKYGKCQDDKCCAIEN